MASIWCVYTRKNHYEVAEKCNLSPAELRLVIMETSDRTKADDYMTLQNSWLDDVRQFTRWQAADAAQKQRYGFSYCKEYFGVISAAFSRKWHGCQ